MLPIWAFFVGLERQGRFWELSRAVGALAIRVLRGKVWNSSLDLNPKSMQNNSPKPIKAALRAFILHTFGVQVIFLGLKDEGCQESDCLANFVDKSPGDCGLG